MIRGAFFFAGATVWLVAGCGAQGGVTLGDAAPIAPSELAPIETLAPTLQLGLISDDGEILALRLDYQAHSDGKGARVAEVKLAYGEGLRFLSARPLKAVRDAGKQLVAQERDGVLRLVVFSTGNLNTLPSGGLAALRFARSGSGDQSVALKWAPPFFAPEAANRGLVMPESLRFEAAGGSR